MWNVQICNVVAEAYDPSSWWCNPFDVCCSTPTVPDCGRNEDELREVEVQQPLPEHQYTHAVQPSLRAFAEPCVNLRGESGKSVDEAVEKIHSHGTQSDKHQKLRCDVHRTGEGEEEECHKESSVCSVKPLPTVARTMLSCALPEELLRATYANVPLRYFGADLRRKNLAWTPVASTKNLAHKNDSSKSLQDAADTAYSKSFSTPVLDDFWSHSWQSPPTFKIVVLLLEYNARAAGILAICAGLLAIVFDSLGLLRHKKIYIELFKDPSQVQPDKELQETSLWCLLFGTLTLFAGLLVWPSQRKVFLDKLCIHQTDEQMKLAGVRGLGAFMKNAQRILVLLDSSYRTRLWCVFEVAAFMKTHEKHTPDNLCLKPLVIGKVSLISLIWCVVVVVGFRITNVVTMMVPAMLVLTALSHSGRSYQRTIADLVASLETFRMSGTKCYCCTVDHIHPLTQETIMCDRNVVNLVIRTWFQSEEEFEKYVQTDVRQCLLDNTGNFGYPVRLSVFTGIPLILAAMDYVMDDIREENYPEAAAEILHGISLWLFFVPLFLSLVMRVCRCTHERGRNMFMDMLKTLFTALVSSLIPLMQGVLYFVMLNLQMSRTQWKAALAATNIVLTVSIVFFRVYVLRISKNPVYQLTKGLSQTSWQ